jgi:hypothetical protein
MKKTLLISVAAIALTAASFASAQTPNRGGPGAAPAAPSNATPSTTAPAPSSAPAEIQATPDHGPAAKPGTNKGAKSTTTPPTQRNTQQQPNKGAPPSNAAQTEPQHGAPNNAQQNERSGTNERERSGTNDRQGANERPMTSRNVSLTTEQRTTIRTKVLTSSAPRVQGRVNFDIRVGVVVPREVRVVALPTEIIEIEPTWRGYMYFVSGDQIIVVEPGTLRIVAVLDV